MKHIQYFILLFCTTLISTSGRAQNWAETQKIVASDRSSYDEFGSAVAIYESTAVVGAYKEDEDEFGANTVASAGSVYVYDMDTNGDWIETQKLVIPDRDIGDFFGCSVSIYGDYIVVGAFEEEEDELGLNNLNHAGSVFIFKKNGSGVWLLVQKIVSSDRKASDRFGLPVSIWKNQLVVGAFLQNYDENDQNIMLDPGAAYVFELDTVSGVWSETQKIVASDRAQDDWFGYSVAIHENTIIAGAYQNNTNATGGANISNAGSAYVFEKDTATGIWTEVQKIVASDRADGDWFGGNVALWEDQIVVGAKAADFDENGLNAVGGSGSVYIYTRDILGTWNQTQKIVAPVRGVADYFGGVVSIHGNYILVTAHGEDEDEFESNTQTNAGAGYLFELDGFGNWIFQDKIDASDRQSFDEIFAGAVCGGHVFLAAHKEDHDVAGINSASDAGSAYIYEIDCPVLITYEEFTICQDDSILLVGAYRTTSGYYVDTLTSSSCSDSLISNYLDVLPKSYLLADTTLCLGDSILLGGLYQSSAGVYFDTLNSYVGCDSIVTTTVSIKTTYNYTVNELICNGDSILLGGSFQTSAGSYEDTIVSLVCYDSVRTTTLSIQSVDLNVMINVLGGPPYIQSLSVGQTGANYQWLNCPAMTEINGATDQSYTVPSNGAYAVSVTYGGCVDTTICATVLAVGVSENDLGQEFIVSPNPVAANGQIRIWASTNAPLEFSIYSLNGKLISHQKIKGNDVVNLSKFNLSTGMYLYSIKGDGLMKNGKLNVFGTN
ncbi:MAG: hypothetical protein ACI8Q1_000701 [Parvicella sp.]|jgi:hypothetical protein